MDFSPLEGMPLATLLLDDTRIENLEPLKKMPLKQVYLDAPNVTDLTPLKGMALEDIRFTPKNITAGLEIIREMKSLKIIGRGHYESWPAAEFWDRLARDDWKK